MKGSKRKPVYLILITSMLMSESFVHAQGSTKTPRIGFLASTPLSANSERIEAFRQGLRNLGYVEGKNIVIEWRSADGVWDRQPALAAELIGLRVDLIVSSGPRATPVLKAATSSIPIIMTNDSDPVAVGYAASLARPGGNITGLYTLAPELSGKRLEIMREIVPRLSRVAVFGTPTGLTFTKMMNETKRTAEGFGLQVELFGIETPKDIESALAAARKSGAHAGLVLFSAIIFARRTQIADLAVTNHLPLSFPQREYVEDGGLMSYGPDTVDLFRRAATYVDKILKGATPADLPIEGPRVAEFVINVRAAKKLGLTIPAEVLQHANKVIE